MKKVTAWSAFDKKDKVFKHSHLDERGWIGLTFTPLFGSADIPEPKFPSQKGWLGLKWQKTYCYLNENQTVIST